MGGSREGGVGSGLRGLIHVRGGWWFKWGDGLVAWRWGGLLFR